MLQRAARILRGRSSLYSWQADNSFIGIEMKRITRESRIKRNKAIFASDIDDEKVMMSVEKGLYYGLNPVGSNVWNLIETPITVSSLVDVLLVQYDVDRETCEKDILAFLEDLYKDGIIQIEE